MPTYTDLDLSFSRHPGTHDILKKYDLEAAKTAIRNVFLIDPYEKPFDPNFGVGIRSLLFENITPALGGYIERQVKYQLAHYDPRIFVNSMSIITGDDGQLFVEMDYHVIGFPQVQTIKISVARTR